MRGVFLLISFFVATSFTHDVAVAVFTLSDSGDHLQLKVVLDRAHLSQELQIQESAIDVKNIQEYLTDHTQFRFDETENPIVINQIKNDADHIIAQGVFIKRIEDYNTLIIKNTTLITIPSHSNIVRLRVRNAERDFRMHKGRKEITIAY